MTSTRIAKELDACRNARPTTQTERDELVARIDAAGMAAANLKNGKLTSKLLSEANELSIRYRWLDLPAGSFVKMS